MAVALVSACEQVPFGLADHPEEGAALVQAFLATSEPLAPYQTGAPYDVAGVAYEPIEDWSYAANGVASVYAAGTEGALTASGETYRGSEYTAAHPTLPFQSIVRVTRLDRNNSVAVRINDRGPFALGRIIDLSKAAADALGVANGGFVEVQIRLMPDETRLFRSALANNRLLRGSSTVGAPLDTTVTSVGVPLSTSLPPPPAAAPPSSTPIPTQSDSPGEGLFVLVGSYTDTINANGIRDRMASLGRVTVAREGNFYQVLIGPLASELEQQAILGRVFAEGAINARRVER